MSADSSSYPWHGELFRRLTRLRQTQKLPHAILFTGQPGIGKEEFVQQWTAALICRQLTVSGMACGQCDSCRQHQAGSYPDVMVLSAEPDQRRVFENYPAQRCQQRSGNRKTARTVITIDQIRELIDKLAQTSHQGGLKIAVILSVDALNIEASNALLKLLEEPPDSTLLLLISERPLNLLATIRSRCQRFEFHSPSSQEVIDWLGDDYSISDRRQAVVFTGAAPRLARDLLYQEQLGQWLRPIEQLSALVRGQESILKVAGECEKQDRNWLTGLLQSWLRTLIGNCAGLASEHGEQVGKNLRVQGDRVHLTGVFELIDLLNHYVATQGIALNNRLMWEEFLLIWQTRCLKKIVQN
ncbi:MAG: DNA polymerase III subunit delta' [Gammaproteobacteria bacterium]